MQCPKLIPTTSLSTTLQFTDQYNVSVKCTTLTFGAYHRHVYEMNFFLFVYDVHYLSANFNKVQRDR